jgi:hypothetical protein
VKKVKKKEKNCWRKGKFKSGRGSFVGSFGFGSLAELQVSCLKSEEGFRGLEGPGIMEEGSGCDFGDPLIAEECPGCCSSPGESGSRNQVMFN